MNEEVPVPIPSAENRSVVTESAQVYIIDNINAETARAIVPVVMSFAALLKEDSPKSVWTRMHNIFGRNKGNASAGQRWVIKSPYEITIEEMPMIDFYINGFGMDIAAYTQIASAISVAKSRGVIVRTTVTGFAAGVGGMLATMGTPGFRIMYQDAHHCLVVPPPNKDANRIRVVGYRGDTPNKNSGNKELPEWGLNAYKSNTRLTRKHIQEVLENRDGYMDAKYCGAHGVCDWILKNDGCVECVIKAQNSR